VLHGKKYAVQIDGSLPAPVFEGHIDYQGTDIPMPAFETRMSSRPEPLLDFAHHLQPAALARHIVMKKHSLMTRFLDASDNLGTPEFVNIGHGN